jgi:NAD(P)-dependent dehydrogenase (short-subunit alcohol dehydrogenase family)
MTRARWTDAEIPDQGGRTVLITGANSGLGLRSAEAMARHGATVLLACRNPDKGKDALVAVQANATGPAPRLVSLDLSELSSVRDCAAEVNESLPRLDVLMNNAGVMAIPLRRNKAGQELQFATNHLGHFALTGLLLPTLLKAPEARVVTTSSIVHRIGKMRWNDLQRDRRYSKWLSYGQSKLSNLLFAFELDRRAKQAGAPLKSMAAHPGYANTHLQTAGPEMAGSGFMQGFMSMANKVFAQSDVQGAWPQLYAATMPDVHGGEYFGPGGMFEQQGHPEQVKGNRRARNEADAARLWQVSEQLTGVSYALG